MDGQVPVPKEIRRLGEQSIRIVWGEGHAGEYSNRYLRDHCPCALCRERPSPKRLPLAGGQGERLFPTQIGLVGRYAVSIQWSDGHDSGIYSFRTLRELCPCRSCRPAGSGDEDAA